MATACLSLALSKATKASLCLPMVRPLCIEAPLGQSEQPSSNLAYAGRTAPIRAGAFLTESIGGTALSRAQGGARGTDITSSSSPPARPLTASRKCGATLLCKWYAQGSPRKLRHLDDLGSAARKAMTWFQLSAAYVP